MNEELKNIIYFVFSFLVFSLSLFLIALTIFGLFISTTLFEYVFWGVGFLLSVSLFYVGMSVFKKISSKVDKETEKPSAEILALDVFEAAKGLKEEITFAFRIISFTGGIMVFLGVIILLAAVKDNDMFMIAFGGLILLSFVFLLYTAMKLKLREIELSNAIKPLEETISQLK